MSNNVGYSEPSGPVYTIPFAGTALTSTSDVFQLTGSTAGRTVIRECRIGQYSDAGDAEAEILQIQFLRGSTAGTTTGSAVTPVNVQSHSGAPSAGGTARVATTTLGSTTSATLVLADIANVAAGYLYRPDVPERIVLDPGERLFVRMSGPADSLTVNGVLTIQEIGYSVG